LRSLRTAVCAPVTASDGVISLIGGLLTLYSIGSIAASRTRCPITQSSFTLACAVTSYTWWQTYGATLSSTYSALILAYSSCAIGLSAMHASGPVINSKVGKPFEYTGVC